MFLALKEMKHEKLRYGLMIGMIFLVSYLVFILTGLSSGLSNLNRAAVDSWQAQSIVLNKDAQINLPQSVISTRDMQKLKNTGAQISLLSGLVQNQVGKKDSAQIVGIKTDQFIFKNLKVASGVKHLKGNQAIVASELKTDGFKLGDTLKIANTEVKVKIVGFTNNASLNMVPVVYTTPKIVNLAKYDGQQAPMVINGVAFTKRQPKIIGLKDSKVYSATQYINKMPGNSAQTLTFNFMIAFLMVIILIVIAIFLYILTMQKLPNFGVLKAQGVPTAYLVKNTILQSVVLAFSGVMIATCLVFITAAILPAIVPIKIQGLVILESGSAIILMAMLGALIPVREIVKLDPYKIIGG